MHLKLQPSFSKNYNDHLSTHPRKSNDNSSHASYPLHIIDGTGGLGGNTIGFLRALWKLYPSQVLNQTRMTMIELDAKRYECGKHNVELFVNDFNEKNRAVSSQ
ncbi:hypothetical protein C9374_005524 [Naegleria lovaniensis]|uniref:Trimethylguanosine synthase n=1 Tax=Naegleria lovaniensis TaxID=51637 RepID=A0AA88KIK8_NAELO|nr:uncharacterized protein C9374_005524 [Naegleria lovaniensis]KAG2382322.1 hypothetical protein C9374_005524 [Naegleria lovaniensis]